MYYQLNDTETEEVLGTVKVLQTLRYLDTPQGKQQAVDEIYGSWELFNKFDGETDVDEFVEFHNKYNRYRIQRIVFEVIQLS